MRCTSALVQLLVAFALVPGAAADDGWVGPFSAIAPSPGDAADTRLSTEARVRWARRLGRHGEARGAVAALLRALAAAPPPPLERELLLALARRADPAALEPLRALFARPGEPPFALYLALAALGAPALPALVQALEQPARQAHAREALLRAGPVAVDALVGALDGPADTVAAELLGALGEPAAIPALLRSAATARGERSDLEAAALAALAQLGAPEVLPLARVALDGAGPLRLRLAALTALTRVGGAPEVTLLRQRLHQVLAESQHLDPGRDLDPGRVDEGGELLRGLCGLDAPGCEPELAEALRSGVAARAHAARALLLRRPHPAWLGLMREVLGHGPDPALAFALARLPEQAGLSTLLEGIPGESGQIDLMPIAVALRSDINTDSSPSTREAALRHLHTAGEGPRALALRGLARDPRLAAGLPAALASESEAIRNGAALAAAWLGPTPSLRLALRQAIGLERDTTVFRSLALAARAQGAAVPPSTLAWALTRPDTAPEALRLAALAGPSPDLDRQLRRALADTRGSARARAAAALALADLGSRRALPALLAALDDPAERVRLAALRAAAVLGDRSLAPALFAHARAEPATDLALLARELAHALREGRPVPRQLQGDRVLVLLQPPGLPPHTEQPLELLLPDGRWLRVAPLAPGEWLVADLPEAGVLAWPLPAPLSN